SQKTIREETNKYPEVEGLSPATFDQEIFEIWSVKKAPARENQSVNSDIPVLLISGEYDNGTPPKWAKAMTGNLPNSHHLIFSAWKHTPTTNWGNPCAMQVANDFFNNPDRKPNTKCLEQIQSPSFKTE
ncbi:MAG: alpha/beta hydrolase, partial [Bacteroidota bacterium]